MNIDGYSCGFKCKNWLFWRMKVSNSSNLMSNKYGWLTANKKPYLWTEIDLNYGKFLCYSNKYRMLKLSLYWLAIFSPAYETTKSNVWSVFYEIRQNGFDFEWNDHGIGLVNQDSRTGNKLTAWRTMMQWRMQLCGANRRSEPTMSNPLKHNIKLYITLNIYILMYLYQQIKLIKDHGSSIKKQN